MKKEIHLEIKTLIPTFLAQIESLDNCEIFKPNYKCSQRKKIDVKTTKNKL